MGNNWQERNKEQVYQKSPAVLILTEIDGMFHTGYIIGTVEVMPVVFWREKKQQELKARGCFH